ncbi:MAG TPA: nuclear transport factor 2 family protein, partial [Vicinamibacterales bacterium]|nr:nuclear transport factor 2 family protein [Vicinamibacterales bacterium]
VAEFASTGDVYVVDLLSDGRKAPASQHARYYGSFMGAMPVPIAAVDLHDLGIVTDGDVAFSHATLTVSGTPNGVRVTDTYQLSDGLRKVDGRWRITQEHISRSRVSIAAEVARAQVSSGNATAVSSLRTLNTALLTYSVEHGGFPPKLGDLASAVLIDASLASGSKGDYVFTYIPGAAGPAAGIANYAIQANPAAAGAGKRYFFTDQTTVIRANDTRPATAADPPMM